MQGVADSERRKDRTELAVLHLYTSASFNCVAAKEGHSKARSGEERSKEAHRPRPAGSHKLLNVDYVAKKSRITNREIK